MVEGSYFCLLWPIANHDWKALIIPIHKQCVEIAISNLMEFRMLLQVRHSRQYRHTILISLDIFIHFTEHWVTCLQTKDHSHNLLSTELNFEIIWPHDSLVLMLRSLLDLPKPLLMLFQAFLSSRGILIHFLGAKIDMKTSTLTSENCRPEWDGSFLRHLGIPFY